MDNYQQLLNQLLPFSVRLQLLFTPILPYALAFAAGAMIFVVVEEVIPETQQDKYTDVATLGFIGGFIVMMTLDVALSKLILIKNFPT